MEKINEIKKYCEKTINDCKKFMFERAKFYTNDILTEQDKEDLLELEPKGLVCHFDSEDLNNHNFDLGKIRLANEILKLIEKIS